MSVVGRERKEEQSGGEEERKGGSGCERGYQGVREKEKEGVCECEIQYVSVWDDCNLHHDLCE